MEINYFEKHCVKSVQIRSFFWSVFSCILTEYGSEKTPYLDTFHGVKVHQNDTKSKRDIQATKTYQKEIPKQPQFDAFQDHIKISLPRLHQVSIEKSTSKRRRYFAYLNYVEQSTSKQRQVFTH